MDNKYTSEYFQNLPDSLVWFEDGSLNMAYNVLDHNIEKGNGNKTALIYEAEDGTTTEITFFSLVRKSNRIANYLHQIGIKKGDRVSIFLPRIPELFYIFLGIMKTGAIASVYFSAFESEALKDRLSNSGSKIVFTNKNLLPRVEKIKNDLSELSSILVVDNEEFIAEYESQSDSFETAHTQAEDYAFMLYTSGTTGKPKGIVHAHYAIIQQIASAKLCLDLQPNDVYWCTADPGWITGIVYSILSNWALGITTVVYGGKFEAEKWYEIIAKHKVTVWYTAPTAIRMLMAKGEELVQKHDLSSLRFLASVGEPLNPEAILWGNKVFGKFFHDTWWQTETGSIMIANTPSLGIHPGSMGKPLPWVEAKIMDDNMEEVVVNEEGNLCLKPYWPSIMRTIWQDEEKYKSYFKDEWYISGDKAKKDEKGYFWFIGRADDLIKTSGERIGPFEVESVLIEHPDVVEAGVIGKPDVVRGEIIKAFVVLKDESLASEKLKSELADFVKTHLAGHAYPREIEFIDRLPKTRSGKIMRRILRAKELGQPIGDISTLEDY